MPKALSRSQARCMSIFRKDRGSGEIYATIYMFRWDGFAIELCINVVR